jgi:hypothetical protein
MNDPDEGLTTTEQVVASTEFDDDTKVHILWALMTGTGCPPCAEEAHQALHDMGIDCGMNRAEHRRRQHRQKYR